MFCGLFPELVGVPRRKPANPFQPFSNDGVPPWNPTLEASVAGFRAVTAFPNEKDPRGPEPSSGCQMFIRWCMKSKPNRMSCAPFIQLALVLKVYDWSLRNAGFHPSVLPSVE